MYVQQLSGGTVCDIDNKPRETELVYRCKPKSLTQKHSTIASAEETRSCSYTIVVDTAFLCEIPEFLAEKDRKRPKAEIACFPITSEQ